MRLLSLLALPSLLALALPLAACGGGSGGGTETLDKQITLPLWLPLSGSMRGTTGEWGDTSGGSLVAGDDFVYGDDYPTRCFLSFDLSPLPAGATISQAVIHVDGRVRYGTPYVSYGTLNLDHVNMGPTITTNDFVDAISGLVPGFPTFLATPGFQPGTTTVTNQVRTDYLNALLVTSFRVGFAGAPVHNSTGEDIEILVNPVNPSQRPTLVVTYR